MKYSILSVAAALAVLTLAGCQRENLTVNTSDSSDVLKFSVGFAGSSEIVLSKGATLTSEDGMVSIPLTCTVTDGIEVNLPGSRKSASVTKGTQYNSESEMLAGELKTFIAEGWNSDKTEFVPSATAVKYSDGLWQTDDTYRWRGSGSKTFLAYANLSSNATVTNSVNPSVKQTFTYTVPTDAREQNDIMLGWYEGDGDGTATAAITMVHPLTAVVFKIGEMDEAVTAIKRISISGVYTEGEAEVTYSVSGSDVVPAYNWGSTRTGSQTVTLGPATGATALEVAADGKIGTSFIILPQIVATNSVVLKVVVERDGSDVELLAYLPAGEWEEGKTNTYTLECDPFEYILNVTGDVTRNYNSTSGPSSYTVTANSNWKLQYTLDNGSTWNDAVANQPIGTSSHEWISFDVVSGGKTQSKVVNATVSPVSGDPTTIHIKHDDALKKADPRGTEDAPWDLSIHDIHGNVNPAGVTTANSYVVSAPGWYAFPLVYGNAVKNGTDNTAAYKNTGGTLTNFLKADGSAIANPYIDGAASVYPLWEDVPDFALIPQNGCTLLSEQDAKAKGLTSLNCKYIMFRVEKENLRQGNALLAVSNGSNIIWSWHIWFTASDLTPKQIKNYAGDIFGVLPCNLGWVEDFDETEQIGFPEETLKIRFVQQNAAGVVRNEVDRTAVRKEHITQENSCSGSSPYWQWGRKDPFIRCNGRSNNEIPASAYSVNIITEPITKTQNLDSNLRSIASSIQNPTTFYAVSDGNHDWYGDSYNYRNLWSASNNGTVNGQLSGSEATVGYTNRPIKTVYDPCPPGYQVPQGNMFSGCLTIDNGDSFNPAEFNGETVYDSGMFRGFKFNTGLGDTYYIPSVGTRSGEDYGNLGDIPSGGNCWTAVYFDDNHVGNRLYFNSGYVCHKGCNPTTNGFQIRPMKEN